jgi:DNA polymerase III alpha subunit
MKRDDFGQPYFRANELCDYLYADPDVDLSKFFVFDPEEFNDSAQQLYYDTKHLTKYIEPSHTSIEKFDEANQSIWYMPDEYKNLDIAKWLLDQCKTEDELQRVGHELLLYQARNLFTLLQYLKYLVDTLKANNVVWGVGRGSSVASYVLYLIGVHRINSIAYDLDVNEFLK